MKKRKGRRGCNQKSKEIIFSCYNFRCVHCGKQFDLNDLTRDHIIPVSYNGENAWTNIVPSCLPCNIKRSDTILPFDMVVALFEKSIKSYKFMLEKRGLISSLSEYRKNLIRGK